MRQSKDEISSMNSRVASDRKQISKLQDKIEEMQNLLNTRDKIIRDLKTSPAFSNVSGQWVSVNDRLPKDNMKVMTCQRNGNIGTGYYSIHSKIWLLGIECIDYSKFNPITHWMKLPDKPIDA